MGYRRDPRPAALTAQDEGELKGTLLQAELIEWLKR
jgi:hypothetical protein